MKNYKVKLAYKGTAYHGFQRQANANTVQQEVEEALGRLLGERVTVYGCSRTDAGVHAREFYFSFKTDNPIPERGIVFGCNSQLPEDIAVLSCEQAEDSFHARYCAKGKEYEYIVHNSEIKDPFYVDTAYRSGKHIDAELLDREAKAFVGEHDFKAFCSADCTKENTTRTIYRFDVKRDGSLVRFTVAGNGFLYNMVRIMVGTLLSVAEGKLPQGCIPQLLESRDRTLAGRTAPPQGLYLNRVFYSEEEISGKEKQDIK